MIYHVENMLANINYIRPEDLSEIIRLTHYKSTVQWDSCDYLSIDNALIFIKAILK